MALGRASTATALVAGLAAVLYLAAAFVLTVKQRAFVFPGAVAPAPASVMALPGFETASVATPDGERLRAL